MIMALLPRFPSQGIFFRFHSVENGCGILVVVTETAGIVQSFPDAL